MTRDSMISLPTLCKTVSKQPKQISDDAMIMLIMIDECNKSSVDLLPTYITTTAQQ